MCVLCLSVHVCACVCFFVYCVQVLFHMLGEYMDSKELHCVVFLHINCW